MVFLDLLRDRHIWIVEDLGKNDCCPLKFNADTREEKFPYCTDISKVRKFRNIISGMRGEGKYEVHSFRQVLRQKIHSKNFNAAEMAENAPAILKAWAEENSIDLEEALNQWAGKVAIPEELQAINTVS
jgi:hypothetical protein